MFRKYALPAVFLTALGLLASANQVAAQACTRVRFARGASTATLRGRIAGYKYVDYIITVRAGQRMHVKFETNGDAEFEVLTPSNVNVEASEEIDYVFEPEETSDYKIRVLQTRAFARRNNASNYTLRISIE
ncbi:MAG TPA: hypothetical protein VK400_16070 [Pyrinomonadaceae bacterium]|nr:hypothetical protein [Pyrinomonadaceae bacterium]